MVYGSKMETDITTYNEKLVKDFGASRIAYFLFQNH